MEHGAPYVTGEIIVHLTTDFTQFSHALDDATNSFLGFLDSAIRTGQITQKEAKQWRKKRRAVKSSIRRRRARVERQLEGRKTF